MSDTVISVEGLGKKYRIAHQAERQRYVALRDVLAQKLKAPFRFARGVRNTEQAGRLKDQDSSTQSSILNPSSSILNPSSPILNPPSSILNPPSSILNPPSPPSSEDFWALKDVSFEVKQGEVLGIIGRNGAGKSTLLKILSRITEPTEGRVRIKGRVASLLEVGTGFHPELSGRENIFLNGAILGMTRQEIRAKFDEIVAFAEVERFLDSPVKRYSSGMHVRLAFAIAAHLEPEILLVDEVLAVGDMDFQRRSLGKMRDVSKCGRAVVFVSHNMAAVRSLTTRGLVLDGGRLLIDDVSQRAIEHYTNLPLKWDTGRDTAPLGHGIHTTIRSARLLNDAAETTRYYVPGQPLKLEVVLETDGSPGLSLDAMLLDESRVKLGVASLHHFHGHTLPRRNGIYSCILNLGSMWLASGTYSIDVTTALVNLSWDHYVESALEFEVPFSNPHNLPWDFKQSYGYGPIALLCHEAPTFTPVVGS